MSVKRRDLVKYFEASGFSLLREGSYVVEVRAPAPMPAGLDNTVRSDQLVLGRPPSKPCYLDNNLNHVLQGRALLCGFEQACATGSGDALGWFNLLVISSVEERRPGYFSRAQCAPR